MPELPELHEHQRAHLSRGWWPSSKRAVLAQLSVLEQKCLVHALFALSLGPAEYVELRAEKDD